ARGEGLPCAHDALARIEADCFGAGRVACARFHFDDHQHAVLPGRDIHFAERRAQAMAEHAIAFEHEVDDGDPFAATAAPFSGAARAAHASPALSAGARA